jgi:hypothetical protein
MEAIASKDREAAREKFYEWCEMQSDIHDEIEFGRWQNDVAYLHISDRKDTHFVRDLTQRYTGNPVRVIDVLPVDENTVAVRLLLADLEVSDTA